MCQIIRRLFSINNDTLILFLEKKLSCARINMEKRENNSPQDFTGTDKGLYAKMNYEHIAP